MSSGVVRELKAPVDEQVIELLTGLLDRARAGNIKGLCVLINDRTEVSSGSAGEWSSSDALYAFECWKHRMLHRNQSGV